MGINVRLWACRRNVYRYCCIVYVAAVSALAKFGAQCDELLPSVLVLLERSVCQLFVFGLDLLCNANRTRCCHNGT